MRNLARFDSLDELRQAKFHTMEWPGSRTPTAYYSAKGHRTMRRLTVTSCALAAKARGRSTSALTGNVTAPRASLARVISNECRRSAPVDVETIVTTSLETGGLNATTRRHFSNYWTAGDPQRHLYTQPGEVSPTPQTHPGCDFYQSASTGVADRGTDKEDDLRLPEPAFVPLGELGLIQVHPEASRILSSCWDYTAGMKILELAGLGKFKGSAYREAQANVGQMPRFLKLNEIEIAAREAFNVLWCVRARELRSLNRASRRPTRKAYDSIAVITGHRTVARKSILESSTKGR